MMTVVPSGIDRYNKLANGLTRRQDQVFRWIVQYIARMGMPPTLREIGPAVGIRSPNGVKMHLLALQQMGWIEIDGFHARGIRILKPIPVDDEPHATFAEGGGVVVTLDGWQWVLTRAQARHLGCALLLRASQPRSEVPA